MKRVPPEHQLYHAWLQCDGAKKRLNSLKRMARQYKKEPGRFAMEKKAGKVIQARWPRPIPDTWGVNVFQFANGLRSTLNYIATELAVKHLGGKRKPSSLTQFPICDKSGSERGGFEYQLTRQLVDVLPDAILEVEYFQPYHRLDRPETHLLAILRELSNDTKHNFLVQPQGRPWTIIEGPAELRIRRFNNGAIYMVVSRINALYQYQSETRRVVIGIHVVSTLASV